MSYNLEKRLVIGLASSALFNLEASDNEFQKKGEAAYREYQEKNESVPLEKGVAFPFIKRLLDLNDLTPEDPLIEVVLLSKNDPSTGLRVMNSIKHYELGITRAAFLQGRSPHKYIAAYNISLFLSANEEDVKQAIAAGYPAGQVLESNFKDADDDRELRISFDFDGVIIDDESESIYQADEDKGLEKFHEHEQQKVKVPHNPGPLAMFVKKISDIQKKEQEKCIRDTSYVPRLRVSIVTARNAPSHERVIHTLKEWGIVVNEAFFLGAIEKKRVLGVLKPHIFFDDQMVHLESASDVAPSVHIPFGVANLPK